MDLDEFKKLEETRFNDDGSLNDEYIRVILDSTYHKNNWTVKHLLYGIFFELHRLNDGGVADLSKRTKTDKAKQIIGEDNER